MGQITSRLRRRYRTDKLERLHTDINNIERDKQRKKLFYKRLLKFNKSLSFVLTILFILLFLFLPVDNYSWLESFLYALPFLVLASLLVPLQSCISWYYKWWLINNKTKLKELRHEKRRLLEDVMDSENYKIAKPILDKYGTPEETRKAYSYDPDCDVSSNASSSLQEPALTSVEIK